jgi:crotonobetainyl-CoA:carnitine CoA-transferase CaiB-like acyl-CoA transferase
LAAIEPPLKGVRVVEFSHAILGPSCGMILADLGAEVIKVEPPGGDKTRTLRGFGAGFFGYFNRNKKSLALDVDRADGRAALRKLLESADVLVENFAPGSMKKRGLGPADLEKINPRLVYCALKGFLPGPYDQRAALDEVVQMMGGLAYMTGPSGRPLRAGTSVVDIMGGMFGAFGTVLALKQRDRTGKGGLVESALFESVVFLMGQHLAITAINGAAPPPMPERVSSWAIYEIFDTSDGQQAFVGITSDGQWKRFCDVFGQAELAADPRLASNNQRIDARPWLIPRVAAIFKGFTKDRLEELALKAELSFAPVARPQDLFDHPHLLANGSLAPTTLPGGVKTDRKSVV